MIRYGYTNWSKAYNTSTFHGPSILFFGSDCFAAQHLEHLVKSRVGIISNAVTAKSVKSTLLSAITSNFGISRHPVDTNFSMDNWSMPNGNFDLGVVVSFGYKIPLGIINRFPLGMINVHPSLLPSYRGASPIQSVLLNRETQTGVSIIDVDPYNIDCGRILASKTIDIQPDETFSSLRDHLAEVGCGMLVNTIRNLRTARENAIFQDQSSLSDKRPFARKLKKQDAFVDCSQMTADDIYTIYRAFSGYMSIFCNWKGKTLFLQELHLSDRRFEIIPGDIIYCREADRLVIGCRSNSSLLASRVQVATRQILSASSFAHGYHLARLN